MLRIHRERPGVISPGPCWVGIDDCWLYTHDSLLGLLWLIVTEWRDDTHLAGY